jgi:bifunctional UDP-N-acetylglucosamine pyrophosphorylase/glucosamine-1-phosphate N-acetyltransferase
MLKTALDRLSNNNKNKEYYLTDAVMYVAKLISTTVKICDQSELIGMNSRKDQSHIQYIARSQINNYWMERGVTFIDESSTIVGPRVILEQDVVLGPNVCLTERVTIGSKSEIGQGCVISNCTIGSQTNIKPYCTMTNSEIGKKCTIGPFANLRKGNVLKNNVHIGNFIELKKSTLHSGVKAGHLSYLGDTEVGERSNLGAGLITCNYDGLNKYKTKIGNGVFVGSGCQLIAPIILDDNSIIGAGSTITNDIPSESLALTRAPLIIKKGAANYIKQKRKIRKFKLE